MLNISKVSLPSLHERNDQRRIVNSYSYSLSTPVRLRISRISDNQMQLLNFLQNQIYIHIFLNILIFLQYFIVLTLRKIDVSLRDVTQQRNQLLPNLVKKLGNGASIVTPLIEFCPSPSSRAGNYRVKFESQSYRSLQQEPGMDQGTGIPLMGKGGVYHGKRQNNGLRGLKRESFGKKQDGKKP